MFRSLQWRLTLYFLFVLLLTNLVLSVFFYARWQYNWRRGAHEGLFRAARGTANLISRAFPEPADQKRIAAFLRETRRSYWWMQVIVLDRQGRILGHNSREKTVILPSEVKDRLLPLLSGQVQDVYWESQSGSESWQHLLLPWGPPGHIFGAVYARLSIPSFRIQRWFGGVIRIQRRFWLEVLLAAVVISGLSGFLLSRSLARPVRAMASAAEAIAAGDLSQRITHRSRDELGQLAEKFNVMAAQVEGLVNTLSDERDQLQEVLGQLRESERRRDELVANVSHELRTPLACIQGCTEALVDGVAATPERKQQCLHTITDEVQYLSRLVDDLLNLARASLGQLDMEKQPIDLTEVARQTVAKFQPQAERSGVLLDFPDPPALPQVQADPIRISQVLTNLLDNALQYTPAGGQIQLTLTGQDNSVFVTVADTGSGIPREELPSVFERFYRADPSRTRGSGGSGLGLAIAREIVQAHGGDIWIESEPDQGTQVGFRLPLASP